MMWFFATLIVLAMGGIAVVASGKGAPLAEAYDDRPDAAVPASGPLRPDDLRRVRFSIALRGYRMSEVDALLDRLAAQLEPPAQPSVVPPPQQQLEVPVEHPAEQPLEDDTLGDERST
jgi:DivIVA domain-containing protein